MNHFEANAQRDALVACHGQLRTIATTLFNVANNIRWLGSGPRCGFFEVVLPDRQPGSSIMPGKVNPVMCESMMQVAARVMGNDQTLTISGAAGGQFQLNIMMPIMGHAALESIRLMASASRAFVDFCAEGLEANPAACEASVEKSLSMVTSLNPYIGYEAAAKLAKDAFATGKTIRELCREKGILPETTLQTGAGPDADDGTAEVSQVTESERQSRKVTSKSRKSRKVERSGSLGAGHRSKNDAAPPGGRTWVLFAEIGLLVRKEPLVTTKDVARQILPIAFLAGILFVLDHAAGQESAAAAESPESLLREAYAKTKAAGGPGRLRRDYSLVPAGSTGQAVGGSGRVCQRIVGLGSQSARRGSGPTERLELAKQDQQTKAAELDAQALADFETAVELDPKNWKALHNRAVSRALAANWTKPWPISAASWT